MSLLPPEDASVAKFRPNVRRGGSERVFAPGLRRVAIVSHTGSLYGAGRSLLELVGSLRSMDLGVGVALPRSGMLESELRSLQCQTWRAPLPSWVRNRDGQSTSQQTLEEFAPAAGRLCEEIRGWGPDLVWTNSSITPVGAMAAKALGVPHVWHLRELNGREYPNEFCVHVAEVAELIGAADLRVAVSQAVKEFYEHLGFGLCERLYNGRLHWCQQLQGEERHQQCSKSEGESTHDVSLWMPRE